MNHIPALRHAVTRLRRETRRRRVRVSAVETLSPRMVRVRFASPELHDFESLGCDDHVKLFVPDANGMICKRDYTPWEFDTAQGTLAIDFALHEAGPATAWAMAARPGDAIEIAGPRGSLLVDDDFDWYLLIGDATALPAIGRRVETLRADVPVSTIVVIDSAAEQLAYTTRAAWEPVWIIREDARDDADRLLAALRALPEGDGYIWIAAEARVARAVRSHVVDTLGHPKAWVRASGYWTMGQPDAHVSIED